MTLDEELRAALSTRAATLTPSPDPLAGIERRARSLHRRRVAAAVTSTALAVLAVAGVGSVLLPDSTGRSSEVATTPTPDASPSVAPSVAPSVPSALDPDRPWAYRGTPVDRGTLDTFGRDWAARHPGSELVPLFGQVYAPSQRLEVVFVGRGADADRWGVVTSSEAGSDFVLDVPLPAGSRSLAAALPGDEGTARLLVVAAPETGLARYSPDGVTWLDMSRTPSGAAGVHVVALGADQDRDRYRVPDAESGTVDEQEAPDSRASGATPAEGTAAPANVLDWPSRGTVDGEVLLAAKAAYAESRQVADASRVEEKVLFAGDDDAGNRYLVGQLWLRGDTDADTVGWVDGPGDAQPELQLKPRVADGAEVVALHVQRAPGQANDTLVVVPRPGTGQVMYAETASEWRPVDMPSNLDGVALVERRPDAQGDRLQLLDGHGELFFEDEVTNLLCGVTSCG